MTNPWLKLSGIGLAALLGLGAPAAALADDDASSRFKAMDTNSDGQISDDEFDASTDRKFVMMDSNHDGRVTVVEMDAYKALTHKQKAAKGWDTRYSSADQIKKMDANRDGSVTEDEFEDAAEAKFDAMDTDDNDRLSKSEWEAGHAKAHKGPGK
jgi:hypothetical protein